MPKTNHTEHDPSLVKESKTSQTEQESPSPKRPTTANTQQEALLTNSLKKVFTTILDFDANSIKNLALTSKQFSFFRSDRNDALGDTYTLMGFVLKADYENAEKVARENPQAMFKRVNYCMNDTSIEIPVADLDSDPTTCKVSYIPTNGEYISPLRCAFKFYDSYMWSMFLNIIIESENEGWLSQFKAQMQTQKTHYDITPLLNAYDNYIKIHEANKTEHEGIKKHHLLTAACNPIGEQQGKMPRHFLLEMFRLYLPEGHTLPKELPVIADSISTEYRWFLEPRKSRDSDFSIEKDKRPALQYITCGENEDGAIGYFPMAECIPLLGQNITAFRGDFTFGANLAPRSNAADRDRESFNECYQQRVNEYKAQLLAFSEKPDLDENVEYSSTCLQPGFS